MIAILEIIAAVLMILLMVIVGGSISIDAYFSGKEDENDRHNRRGWK